MNNDERKTTLTIVAVRTNTPGSNEIDCFKLSDGRVITKKEAYQLAQDNVLIGVTPCISSTGEYYIRADADASWKNNLSELPRF